MGVISEILEVWTSLVTWFTTSIGSISSVFYVADTGLTFIGGLTILGIALAVGMLVFNVVKDFVQLRG